MRITCSRRDGRGWSWLDEGDHANAQTKKQARNKPRQSAGTAVGIAARILVSSMIVTGAAAIPLAAISVWERGWLSDR